MQARWKYPDVNVVRLSKGLLNGEKNVNIFHYKSPKKKISSEKLCFNEDVLEIVPFVYLNCLSLAGTCIFVLKTVHMCCINISGHTIIKKIYIYLFFFFFNEQIFFFSQKELFCGQFQKTSPLKRIIKSGWYMINIFVINLTNVPLGSFVCSSPDQHRQS